MSEERARQRLRQRFGPEIDYLVRTHSDDCWTWHPECVYLQGYLRGYADGQRPEVTET